MKKFNLWSILIVFFLAFAITGVNAQTLTGLTATNVADKNNPTHGSNSQEASNPEDDDTANFDIFVTSNVRVTNNDLTTITIGSINVNTATGFSTNDLQITLVNTGVMVTAGNTADLQIRARIPRQLDAVDDNFDEVAFIVATVDLLDNVTSLSKGSIEIWMQRENQLRIRDVDASINGLGKQSLDDGDNLENIKPGDRIEIEVEAENNFDDRTNLDINDVQLEMECDDESNFDYDDPTQEIGDIGTEEEERETITLDVEDDAKDQKTSCFVTVEGDDENGARHGDRSDFDIDVERKNHDLLIRSVNANPTSLSCDDTSITVRVEFVNLGRSNEKRVAIEGIWKVLGFQERVAGFELDEDDTDEKTFVISVDPTQLKQGPSTGQFQTFYDNTKLSDTATVTVDNLCSEGAPTGTGTTRTTGTPTTISNALVLSSGTVSLDEESLASLAVKVVNKQTETIEYTVSLENTEEFAESSSSKKVFLTPGQETTVFLNLKARSNVPEGMYSGTVVLMDDTGRTVETKTFTVETSGTGSASTGGFNLFGDDSNSRIFWIIGDIILIIVAIFFIKLIFTGGRRKAANKRMADYEVEAARKRK